MASSHEERPGVVDGSGGHVKKSQGLDAHPTNGNLVE